MINESWNEDPKRTLFTLSRYKFVAKMLAGYERVLEVGCADAFATRIVQQAVGQITAVDFDPVFVEDSQQRSNPHWPISLAVHDGPCRWRVRRGIQPGHARAHRATQRADFYPEHDCSS